MFRRLGKGVVARRKAVVAIWILTLLVIVPFIGQVGKVTSLEQGSAAGNKLESTIATSIISAQFQKAVPNSTLIIVVDTKNASSVSTQDFVRLVVAEAKSNLTGSGLKETLDVYSTLGDILAGLNKGTYAAVTSANSSEPLLFGVPALYFGIWQEAYANTPNIPSADRTALSQASAQLSGENQTAYKLYTSKVLSLFNDSWGRSWQTAPTITPVQRASLSAREADLAYIGANLQASKGFGDALVEAVTLQEYMGDSPGEAAARLSSFAVGYVANTSSVSPLLVNASHALGKSYDNSSLHSLVGNVIQSPRAYGVSGQLSSLVSSFVSPSRDLTLVTLGFDHYSDANLLTVRSIVQSALEKAAPASGPTAAQVTGNDAISYDFGNSTQADLGLILPVTIGLLIAATGLFFRSALTPFVTLGTIGVALGISQIFVLLVGTYVSKVDFTIPTILLTVLIGVGTDYSVFIIARYREERVNGREVGQAIETSLTWAGESIATSGATVIVSFLSLSLTSIVYLRTIGLVVGLGVLVALSVALTMVPAILAFVGGRAFWPNSGQRFERYAVSVRSRLTAKRGYFSRSSAFAVKRAKLLVLLAFIVSVPAIYAYATTVPTYDFVSSAPASLESVGGSNHLTSSFGGGILFPTYVVVSFASPLVTSDSLNGSEFATVARISAYLASNPDIANVSGPSAPFGSPLPFSTLNSSSASDKETFDAVLQQVGQDNKTALITANFKIDPYSTQAIRDASVIRAYLHKTFSQSPGVAQLLLGGSSGSILDTKNVFDAQFDSVLPIVAVGVGLVLLFVLGSLFLPLFAVVSVLMSIVWTLAVTKLVFQTFFNYQILFITPLFLFVVLLGLGMDYNIFILTRIREEAKGGLDLDGAIIGAVEQTGGIITAAAIILAGSLGALMLSGSLLLKQIGFAFFFSILVDALVVRTYIVPAVMSMMKKWNWYNPVGRLNRSRDLFEAEQADRGLVQIRAPTSLADEHPGR